MSLRNSRPGNKTPPGPAFQASGPAERNSRAPGPGGGGGSGGGGGGGGGTSSVTGVMIFSQVFVMAPIRSQDAELIFDVTQTRTSSHGAFSPPPPHSGNGGGGGGGNGRGGGNGGAGGSSGGSRTASATPRRVGTCRISLRELADQKEHDLPLTVLKKVRVRFLICQTCSRGFYIHYFISWTGKDTVVAILIVISSDIPAVLHYRLDPHPRNSSRGLGNISYPRKPSSHVIKQHVILNDINTCGSTLWVDPNVTFVMPTIV